MKKNVLSGLLVFLSAGMLTAGVMPHIGFVYPSGALPGSTVTVTIGGQYLRDFSALHISGIPVDARMTDYLRIYDRQEMQRVRRAKENIEVKITEAEDENIKQMLQRSLDAVDQEQAMINDLRRMDRMNPGAAAKRQFNPQIAERITLEFNVPANIKPGDFDLRVITTNGISNPLLFQIGQLPEVSEQEPNDLISSPEKLPEFPVLVNGQIMPGDVDCFRFSAKKGQTLVFRADARALVPYLADAVPGWFQSVLTLYDAKGSEVAYNDDYLLSPDPALIYNVPESGDYTLSIRDSIFRGREDFVYRLSMGELPFIERISPLGGTAGNEIDMTLYGVNLPAGKLRIKTDTDAPCVQSVQVEKNGILSNTRIFSVSPLPDADETEPNNLLKQAVTVTNSVVINGTIGKPGDQDWFRFEGRENEKKTIEVYARRFGSPLDARLVLMDAKQQVLAVSDDVEDKSFGLITHHADARIDLKLPARGIYYVRLDDLQNKGGDEFAYRLMMGQEQPDFQLRAAPASLRIPVGGSAVVTVHAIRSGGFTGPVDLSIVDAPGDVELQKAVIPEGADFAPVMVTSGPKAEKTMMELEIRGIGDCGRMIRRRAIPAEDMMQAFIYRHLVPARKLLVEVAEPDPATVTVKLPPDGVIRARPGADITLNAAVTMRPGVQGGITLALASPPEWLSLTTTKLSQPGRSGNIVLKVSPNAEPGYSATVLLNGSVRVGKSPKDPDFNPVLRAMNAKTVDFTVDALAVEIIN